MFAHINTGIKNQVLPNSSSTINCIMHLNISFHELQLTQGSSYITLSKWFASKNAVLNPQNKKDEECFKWAVNAELHHEEISSHPERISKLKPYSDLYNWKGLDFPVTGRNIDKFKKSNKDIAVNVLYIHQKEEGKSKGKIVILRRSDGDITHDKVVNLLLITDDEKLQYTCIKSLSGLLSRENRVKRDQQYCCVNCLQAFNSTSLRDKHYGDCIDHEVCCQA